MSIYNRYDILTEFAKKKKSNARTCLNGAKDATGASQTFDAAKVQFFFKLSKFTLAKMRKIAKFISFAMRIFAKLYASVPRVPVQKSSNKQVCFVPPTDKCTAPIHRQRIVQQ